MSDKLEWLNQHFVLLKYNTMDGVIREGGYTLEPNYTKLYAPGITVQDFMHKLVEAGFQRAALDVLAYAIHRRAGVWWGVCSLRKLYAELDEAARKTAEEEKASEAKKAAEEEGKAKQFAEAKKAAEARKVAEEAEQKKEYAEVEALLKAKFDEAKEKFTQKQRNIFDQLLEKVNKEFVDVTGKDLAAFLRDSAEAERKAAKKKEEEKKQETPEMKGKDKPEDQTDAPMSPEMFKQLQNDAYNAACAWVQDPSADNSIWANRAAEPVSSDKEGLLARTAFWSFGNLSVEQADGSNTPAPAGLAANGLRAFFLTAIITKGGLYSPEERTMQYLNLGCEIACGRKNWTVEPDAELVKTTDTKSDADAEPAYHKWK